MFDVTSELAIIRARRKMMRRKRYRSSRLDEYRAELQQLRAAGATLADIALWLRQRRIRVAISTISRWLRLCREVPDA